MNKLLLGIFLIIFILIFFFAPSTCNNITYYRGYRGCGKDNSNNNNVSDKSVHLFWNLINF